MLLGKVIELESVDAESMRVVGPMTTETDAGRIPQGCHGRRRDEDGRRAQVEFSDYWYRNKFHGGSAHAHRAIVGISGVHSDDAGTTLRLNYGQAFKGSTPRRGEPLPALSLLSPISPPTASCSFCWTRTVSARNRADVAGCFYGDGNQEKRA